MRRPDQNKQRYSSRRLNRGQAMTELAIVAAAFLVPLFLLIPLLGKQIDMKHHAIQAARYQAWEYTVWYTDNNRLPEGFDADNVRQPVKDTNTTQAEARRRFFSKNTLPIEAADRQGWDNDDRNPLWRAHTGSRLYSNDAGPASSFQANKDTPDATGGIFNGILDALDTVFSLMADIASFLNIDVGFTAINTDGLFKTTMDVQTNEVKGFMAEEPLFPATNIKAQAAVLGEGWNAGGRAHAEHQVGGIVPTKVLGEILEKEPFKTVLDVISVFIPEFAPCNTRNPMLPDSGSLWLGFIDFDTVHPDRLDGSDTDGHACFGGTCKFSDLPYERKPTVINSQEDICGYRPK